LAAPPTIEHHPSIPSPEEPAVGLSIDELTILLSAFDKAGWENMKLAINGTRLEITRGRARPSSAPEVDHRAPAPAHHEVTAPSVGVFHRGPAPGAPRSVEPGDHVEPDDVLGIVQVTRRTHRVLAGISGTVRSVHAEDREPVEYGRLLFTIEAIP
jgi:biotin carboxyl carrier protein